MTNSQDCDDLAAYAAHMASKRKLSARLDFLGLSKRQEAFAHLDADGMPVTEAVSQFIAGRLLPVPRQRVVNQP